MIFNLNYDKYLKYLEKGVDEVNNNFLDCYDTNVNEVAKLIREYGEKIENNDDVSKDDVKEITYMFTIGALTDKALDEIGEKNKVFLFQEAINNNEEIVKKIIPFVEMINLYLSIKD